MNNLFVSLFVCFSFLLWSGNKRLEILSPKSSYSSSPSGGGGGVVVDDTTGEDATDGDAADEDSEKVVVVEKEEEEGDEEAKEPVADTSSSVHSSVSAITSAEKIEEVSFYSSFCYYCIISVFLLEN